MDVKAVAQRLIVCRPACLRIDQCRLNPHSMRSTDARRPSVQQGIDSHWLTYYSTFDSPAGAIDRALPACHQSERNAVRPKRPFPSRSSIRTCLARRS